METGIAGHRTMPAKIAHGYRWPADVMPTLQWEIRHQDDLLARSPEPAPVFAQQRYLELVTLADIGRIAPREFRSYSMRPLQSPQPRSGAFHRRTSGTAHWPKCRSPRSVGVLVLRQQSVAQARGGRDRDAGAGGAGTVRGARGLGDEGASARMRRAAPRSVRPNTSACAIARRQIVKRR